MNKLILSLFLGLSLTTSIFAKSTIVDSLKSNIEYLASPELEGRGFENDGNKKAGEFIEKFFKEIKLNNFKNNYFQEFTAPIDLELGKINIFELISANGKKSFSVSEDYIPSMYSSNGSVESELVFVGYGISAEKINYDDYANVEATGKIAVILRGSPEKESDSSKFSKYVSLREKMKTAVNKKASGIIFISFDEDYADNLPKLELERFASKFNLPIIFLKASSLNKENELYSQINAAGLKIKKELKPNSFAINSYKAKISTELKNVEKSMPNVIGFVEGIEKKDEYIVIGAHFDHLGFGGSSSLSNERKPHVGADDNASGVAAMMQLAYRLKQKNLKRSIIFVGFNGEEKGLLGSAYFVNNSPVPINNIVGMLNFDMVGRMKENKLNILGAGTSSIWKKIIEKSNTDKLQITETDDGMGPSDNASFLPKNIPVLFFFTGVHTDYHKPSDSPDKINYDGTAKVVDLAERLIIETANLDAKPDYVKIESKNANREMRGAKVQFGAIPDFGDNSNGFKVSGATPGTPADKAGIKANDVIVKFGAKNIKDIYDFMDALADFKPNDEVEVTILRDGKQMTLKAVLTGRKGNK